MMCQKFEADTRKLRTLDNKQLIFDSPIGIQTILDQFFHDTDGTLNYFSSSDPIDYLLGEW